jgi:hypothetical protein
LELDTQWLVNVGFGAAGAFGMWIVNRLTTSVQKIEDDIKEFPLRYVAKDDYRTDIAEIKTMLHDIYKELRNKADK